VVYLDRRFLDPESERQIEAIRKTTHGGHADEAESSCIIAIRPDLVHLDCAADVDGAAKGRLRDIMRRAFTGIWWYADYPEHYAGDAGPANAELGELTLKLWAYYLAKLVRKVKRDKAAPKLQEEFRSRAKKPLAEGRETTKRGGTSRSS